MRVNVVEIIINGLINGSIYALISMGLSMQYGVAKILNVAHGEFIMIGAFITWALVMAGVHPILALIICCPIIALVGFVLHRTIYKRLRDISPSTGAFEGNAMLLSFGIMYVIQSIGQMIWGSNPHRTNFMNTSFVFLGATVQRNKLVVFAFALGISILFYLFLMKSRLGKSIRAAAQDPVAAGIMGIKINTVMAICFGLGALLACAAGALLSMYKDLYSVMGMGYTVTAIIVVVLGGLGSAMGSLIGGFILGLVGYAVSTVNSSLEIIAFYIIIMALLLVRPKGLLGR